MPTGLDPTSLLPLLPAAVTAIGIYVAVRSPERQRAKQRIEVARAALKVTEDALALVASRLAIRFDPALLPSEGLSMRQRRATACLETLREFKVADLPASLIGHFSAVRGGLSSLNEAMSSEPADGWPPNVDQLSYYQNVWSWTIGPFGALCEEARKLGLASPKLPQWSPPQKVVQGIANPDYEKVIAEPPGGARP